MEHNIDRNCFRMPRTLENLFREWIFNCYDLKVNRKEIQINSFITNDKFHEITIANAVNVN